MNREETAFGVDSLFRLIGTGEDNDRRGQVETSAIRFSMSARWL
jgi:hypothetical protein